jgi:hypothetical protein
VYVYELVNIAVVFVPGTKMEVEPEVGAEHLIEEQMFGVLDIVLLLSLLGLGGWWLLKNRRQPDEPSATKSYSIQ